MVVALTAMPVEIVVGLGVDSELISKISLQSSVLYQHNANFDANECMMSFLFV